MSGIRDTATVTLNVNGAQAKQMLSELESKVKATEDAIKKMKAANADPKDEFMKRDTRTAREDLNKLAQEAGRLGKTS